MGKRITFDAAARDAMLRGVEQLAAAVRVTLGPRGRNVLLDRGTGSPIITNDGLTIAREIELADRFENMGVRLAREAAIKTGEVAGDGTTTATVLAHAVIRRGLKAIASGHSPVALRRGIERAVVAVVEDLKNRSRPVESRDSIRRVAAVAAGEDEAIGDLVAEAVERVGRKGVITVEEGRGMEATLEVVEGVRFDRGYLSPYFVTHPDTMEAVLENPLVLLTEHKCTAARDVMTAMECAARSGRPLLVVADDIEGEALATLVVNRLRGTITSVAVKAPLHGERRTDLLEDLAVLTGARRIAPELGASLETVGAPDLGRAGRVIVDHESTTLIEGGGRPAAIRERIALVERLLASRDSDWDRDGLRERLARLTGGVAVIRVGAPTELALQERRSRIEDALAATRAALEEGVVAGGGVALVRSQDALRSLVVPAGEELAVQIIREALEEPARQIAENAGLDGAVVVGRIRAGTDGFGFNAQTGEFCDLIEAGILDPTRVTRSALQHAASVGTMVLTTDAIVVDSDAAGEGEAPPE
ncbi:MAG: chaperonin GroEL [Candidatus Eisenbacteria bacterium]|nr:chaperonin GroEL [Candidatus Eisenbacteria bacterium]